MESLRKPFFFVALALATLVVLIELSSLGFLGSDTAGKFQDLQTPGLGVSYLALYDGIVLFSIVLMGLALLIPARVHGRLQGVVNLIFFLLMLIGAIVLIFVAIGMLVLMVTLLMAVPFGTIAYMVAFADFDVTGARVTLGMLMTLKLAFAVCLVLAHQRFLEMKGLVLLVLFSLLLNVVVSFLHALGPGFVVSILDAAAGIVVGIVAAIWALISLVMSIPAIVKALRVDRALA